VNSSTSNAIWSEEAGTSRSTGAGKAIVPANEEVLCWDIKKGELLGRWKDSKCRSQVTALAHSTTDKEIFAVGYEDGSIRLWDSKIATVIVSFNGHRSAITGLAFDSSGIRLASGAKDTDIILWDLIAEVGLFKLRGHKDQITGLQFLSADASASIREDGESIAGAYEHSSDPGGYLLTTGKDALIKLWDLTSQHCIETHVAQTNGECWSLGVSPDGSGCITAGNDGELMVWSIDTAGLSRHSNQVDDNGRQFLHNRGVLHRTGRDRTLEIKFHPRRDYIAVHGSEKNVELEDPVGRGG